MRFPWWPTCRTDKEGPRYLLRCCACADFSPYWAATLSVFQQVQVMTCPPQPHWSATKKAIRDHLLLFSGEFRWSNMPKLTVSFKMSWEIWSIWILKYALTPFSALICVPSLRWNILHKSNLVLFFYLKFIHIFFI